MTIEENKEVVRKAYSSITEGNLDGFFDCLTDDVKWTFIGTHRFGRSFVGKEDITNNLFGPLGEILEGTIHIGIKSLTAEGQRVVMEAEGKSSTKTGGLQQYLLHRARSRRWENREHSGIPRHRTGDRGFRSTVMPSFPTGDAQYAAVQPLQRFD